jgi:glutaconate CoA-transferase subunit B
MVVKEITPFERMLVTAAREIPNGGVIFVGFHWPMLIARIARRTHANNLVVIYENGTVEDHLTATLPTSPSDLVSAANAAMCGTVFDSIYSFLGRGHTDLVLLEAPIVDQFGNVDTTVVGEYSHPTVRLPGSGGGTELAALGRGLLLVNASLGRRSFPATVDYITSPGYLGGAGEREELGYPAWSGPKVLVTPLGRFEFDSATGVAFLTGRHIGISSDAIRQTLAWPIDLSQEGPELPDLRSDELYAVKTEMELAEKRNYLLPNGR